MATYKNNGDGTVTVTYSNPTKDKVSGTYDVKNGKNADIAKEAGINTPSSGGGGNTPNTNIGTAYGPPSPAERPISQMPLNPLLEEQQPTDDQTDTSNYINQLKEAQRQSRIAALDKAKSSALSALDTEQENVEPLYYNKRNQAAANSEVGALNFAQFMAARGIKGAAGAMPEIYRNAGLQGQIGALDQAEAQNMANIERQKGLVNSNYEFDVAQSNADIESQAMQNQIDQYNRDRDYNLSLGQLTGNVNGTPTLQNQQFQTEATGYYNPWASQYALDDDARSQLAPYMNNLQGFIDENPESPLWGYAQNARFEKIMSDPTLRDKYGSQYQTAQARNQEIQNKLAQLQMTAQEIENSYLPETLKLQAKQLAQEVEAGRLAPETAQAQLDQIKAETYRTLHPVRSGSTGELTAYQQYQMDKYSQQQEQGAREDAIKSLEEQFPQYKEVVTPLGVQQISNPNYFWGLSPEIREDFINRRMAQLSGNSAATTNTNDGIDTSAYSQWLKK